MANEDKLMSKDELASLRESIKQKRRIRAQRRRKALFRLLILLLLLLALVAGLIYAGYKIYTIGDNAYQNYQAVYAGYKERRQQRLGDIKPDFDGYTNVLIMGLDDGADEVQGGRRPDTIMIASLNNQTGQVRFINIPRDTWLALPVSGSQVRLKDMYTAGGTPMVVKAISNLLGIAVHQYIAIDMSTFTDLIDIIGGIDLYVEKDMDYEDPAANFAIHIKQGYQHLDGTKSQEYLRYRSDDLGDVGRIQRQQQFLKALYQKVLQLETIPKLPAIAEVLHKKADSSAEIFDSLHLVNVLRHLSTSQPISITLPGVQAEGDNSIWLPDDTAIHKRMQELFPVETLNDASEEE